MMLCYKKRGTNEWATHAVTKDDDLCVSVLLISLFDELFGGNDPFCSGEITPVCSSSTEILSVNIAMSKEVLLERSQEVGELGKDWSRINSLNSIERTKLGDSHIEAGNTIEMICFVIPIESHKLSPALLWKERKKNE